MDFPSKEALSAYLKQHPGANRRKHRVVKPTKPTQKGSRLSRVLSKFKHISKPMRSALNRADDLVLEMVVSEDARKKVGAQLAEAIERSPQSVANLIRSGMEEETRSSLDGLKVAQTLVSKGPHKLSAREAVDLYTFCSYALVPVLAAFPPGGLIVAASVLGQKYLMGVGLNIGLALARQRTQKTGSVPDDVYDSVASHIPNALREGLTSKQMEVILSS